ncbi:casein kinase substrate phospho protein PP28-domain-containing protein [Pterulicium gracile]|uniref:Casein kinase substrate phospho protein PP28-domain-containing protein n=1 Tax=Pterulicium gracile TaxID=1884261 RepID=A0A5C3Q017_9AGAR|nr:casein kinase substrate phospho protein PP28-domain-containing protein [Pterula gracilis]
MVRGTGKFKQKRGGGRSFSKNMTLDENGTAVGEDRRRRRRPGDEDLEEDSDEDDSSEEEEEEEGSGSEEESGEEDKPEMTRAERKALKKQEAEKKKPKPKASTSKADGDGSEDDDSDLINPNHVKTKLNISDLGGSRELSRREREQKEKQEAKEKYWKLHMAGKTDQAKTDLARLAKIKADREAAQAKRTAEAYCTSTLECNRLSFECFP